MPCPRRTQISVEDTPFYHAVSRCVRKAWLTGVDSQTGRSYEHRREWVESQLVKLGEINQATHNKLVTVRPSTSSAYRFEALS